MRIRFWLASALLTLSNVAAGAETATQAFAGLPPLASAATRDMDCSAEETVGKKVEARLEPMRTMPMTAGGSVANLTPAQMQAMTAMADPAFNECVTQLQAGIADNWQQPLKDKLEARLQQVEAGWRKASEDFCRKSNDENCRGSPAIDRQFNQQAAAAGTQFLKDAQPQYARRLKDVGDCIASREKAMGGASGSGGNTPMDAIFASNAAMTWGLLNLPANANSSLCKVARDAAGKYVFE